MPIFKWLEKRKQAKLEAEQKEIKERRKREEKNQAERARASAAHTKEIAERKAVEQSELKNQREMLACTQDEILDDIIDQQEDYLRRAGCWKSNHDHEMYKQMLDERKQRVVVKAALRIRMCVTTTKELIAILNTPVGVRDVQAVYRLLAAREEAEKRHQLNSFIEKEAGYQPEEIPNGNANQSSTVTESAARQEDSGSNSNVGICIPKYWPGSEPVNPT